jgi:hypothetical protein
MSDRDPEMQFTRVHWSILPYKDLVASEVGFMELVLRART